MCLKRGVNLQSTVVQRNMRLRDMHGSVFPKSIHLVYVLAENALELIKPEIKLLISSISLCLSVCVCACTCWYAVC